MSLTKWERESEIFPSFFEDFFGRDLLSGVARGTSIPAINVCETDRSYLVEVAAPGLKKEDFKVNLENHVLTISAEKKEEKNEKEKKMTRKEFSFTSFQRSFTLPDAIDASKIDATYNNGILTLTLPKREEAIRQPAKQIPIK